MSQIGQHSAKPAKFGPQPHCLAHDNVAKVFEGGLPRVRKAGLYRISSRASSLDFGSSFTAWVLQSPRGVGELWGGGGIQGRTSSATWVQRLAGNIDSFQSAAEDVPDAS